MKKLIFCLLVMSSTLLCAQDGTNTLTKGTEISGNQKLISANSLFSLEIAGGVPVIFNSYRDTVWEGSKDINRLGNVGSKLKMQTDGNLCLYTSQNGYTWCYGGPLIGNKAVLENDGRFVLYDNANNPIWLSSYAVPTGIRNPAISPKLISTGSEGIRQSNEIAAGREINLEVIFVDWSDKQVPDTIKNFDSLWKKISSGDKLINSFRDKGVTVKIKLNKQWKRMPKSFASYFPTNKKWDWQGYTNDAAALLESKAYSANTIAVVVPDEGVAGFTCPSGAHGISYNGIRRMITLVPDIYNEHYTTLMHEIGHCYGSGELYPADSPYLHEVAGYDLMGDVVYATGFIGYHQFRYGWITTEKMQLLYQTGTYTIDMKKMSATTGKNMIVIPDKTKQSKLWIIEIGQDVVSRDQFKAGKGEKMNTEGDRLILYTVEDPVESGKRAIRLIPRFSFDANQGSKKWLDSASFIAGQAFSKTNVPFSFAVNSKNSDGFNITVTIKEDISYPKTTTTIPTTAVTNPATCEGKDAVEKYPALFMKLGDILQENEKLMSANGRFQLRGTLDGNFIIEESKGSGNCPFTEIYRFPLPNGGDKPTISFLRYGADGNVCVVSKQGKYYCATYGNDAVAPIILNKSEKLELTNDGRLILVNSNGLEIWATSKKPPLPKGTEPLVVQPTLPSTSGAEDLPAEVVLYMKNDAYESYDVILERDGKVIGKYFLPGNNDREAYRKGAPQKPLIISEPPNIDIIGWKTMTTDGFYYTIRTGCRYGDVLKAKRIDFAEEKPFVIDSTNGGSIYGGLRYVDFNPKRGLSGKVL